MSLIAIAGACSNSNTTDASTAESFTEPPTESSGFPADWSPGELDWTECDLGSASRFECATLPVPLDWSNSDGATIDLALARSKPTRAPTDGEPVGSLIANPGGPGASGIDFLAAGPFDADLASHFNLVSWDPRGVGRSTSVDCDGHAADLYMADPTPDDDVERSEASDAATAIVADCTGAGGDLLEHLNTEEVARDLEAIRLALGSEKLNYVGFSYGTHIGQEYAELFGPSIRTMVLDGVVDPALDFEQFLTGQAEGFDAAFEEQSQACAGAGIETCGVQDLTSAYDEVMQQAESGTIGLGPDGSGAARLAPAQVALAATYTGYLTDGWQMLGPALADALDGDGRSLAALAASYVDLAAYGSYAGVVCTDSAHPEGLDEYEAFTERITEVSPRFGPSIAAEMLPCATWPVEPQDVAAPLTAPLAPPILVVGNTGDPATPFANAQTVADTLESGVLLTVESEGHTAYGSNQCATEVIDAYLIDLAVPDPGTRC